MSKDKKANTSGNTQRYAYQLTINNPLTYGYDHHRIKETLITNFSTLKYFCMADEIGKQGTPHTHIYVHFSSRVRFNTVKKHFPEAHIVATRGSVSSNIDYIQKSGKWCDSEKAEFSVLDTFEEWGTVPKQKGLKADMEELFELLKDGYSNAEILAINNDYILNIDKLDKVRTTLLKDKYKNHRRTNLKVVYISGATGTGKTRGVLDKHGDSNVYRTSDYKHPFDHYECQPVMVFDEYRSQIGISDFLNYTDIYPIELPARYANKFACYEFVYIISNWSLEKQYTDVQASSPESWQALLRRINEVQIYHEDGAIDIYRSVDEYLNRDKYFHPLSPEESAIIPFNDTEGDNDVPAKK